jgi:hypothetical protein
MNQEPAGAGLVFYREPSAGGFVFLVFRVFFWLNHAIEVRTCSRFRQLFLLFAS